MSRNSGGRTSAAAEFRDPRRGRAGSIRGGNAPSGEIDCQRVDRWLWHARLVRTRNAAASLATAGYVRVNGARIAAPSRLVRAGDVITLALDRGVHVLKVCGFVARRGPAGTVHALYESVSDS